MMGEPDLEECLKILCEKEGSDLYYSPGAPPSAKFYGTLNKLSDRPMKPGETVETAHALMSAQQQAPSP